MALIRRACPWCGAEVRAGAAACRACGNDPRLTAAEVAWCRGGAAGPGPTGPLDGASLREARPGPPAAVEDAAEWLAALLVAGGGLALVAGALVGLEAAGAGGLVEIVLTVAALGLLAAAGLLAPTRRAARRLAAAAWTLAERALPPLARRPVVRPAPIDPTGPPWPLTAPETHLLLRLGHPALPAVARRALADAGLLRPADAARPVELGVLELVARGCLQRADARRENALGEAGARPLLAHGSTDPEARRALAAAAPALLPVWDAFAAARPEAGPGGGEGLTPLELIEAADRAFGRRPGRALGGAGLGGYARGPVAAALAARGLCAAGRPRLTAAGRAALAELLGVLGLLYAAPARRGAADTADARSVLRRAGAAALLDPGAAAAHAGGWAGGAATSEAGGPAESGTAAALALDPAVLADLACSDELIRAAVEALMERRRGRSDGRGGGNGGGG